MTMPSRGIKNALILLSFIMGSSDEVNNGALVFWSMKLFVFPKNKLLISVEWSFFTWMDFYVVSSLPNRKFPTLINLIAWILTADILSQIFMTNKFGWFFCNTYLF